MLRHALAPVVPRAAAALQVPRRLPEGSAGIAVTFDDGPHPRGTPAVMDVLARRDVRATFFVVGEQVRRRPDLVREIVSRGHQVALHGYRHRLQLRLRADAVREDLRRGRATIEDAIGATPIGHRPPYGIYSAAGLAAARGSGMRPLLWSRWGKDWRKYTTPDRIARRATAGLQDRDVILLHDADFYSAKDSHERTVEALRLILAELEARQIGTVLAL